MKLIVGFRCTPGPQLNLRPNWWLSRESHTLCPTVSPGRERLVLGPAGGGPVLVLGPLRLMHTPPSQRRPFPVGFISTDLGLCVGQLY